MNWRVPSRGVALSVDECLKKFEVHLTPPALVERLCRGEHLPEICREAIFADELLELAEALGRKHLVTLISCGP